MGPSLTFYSFCLSWCVWCSPTWYGHLPSFLSLYIQLSVRKIWGLQYIEAPKFYLQYSGMKREGYYKTRFCVSREGLPNELGTFSSPWFMFENKTKNMFLTRRGSNIMEPGRQYIGAHRIFFPKNDSYVWIYLLSHKWSLIRLNLSNMGLVRLNKGFSISHKFCLKIWQEGAPIYWGPGSIILEPRLQYIRAPSRQKSVFVLFLNMNHSKLKVLSPFDRPSCDTQNLVLS